MTADSRITRFLAGALAAAFLWTTLPLPAAQAAVIGTDQVVAAAEQERVKDRLDSLLARQDVRAALAAHGVDPAEAQARVDALTPAEAQRIATRLEELPAGAGTDILGALLFLFVLLLVTDLLGLTDVFPFTR